MPVQMDGAAIRVSALVTLKKETNRWISVCSLTPPKLVPFAKRFTSGLVKTCAAARIFVGRRVGRRGKTIRSISFAAHWRGKSVRRAGSFLLIRFNMAGPDK